MFTGIITDIGSVTAVTALSAVDRRIEIATAFAMADIPLGASICCSGVCLTVVEKREGRFSVDVSGETLSKTSLGRWAPGRRVNLERSLKLGDELGGHFVFGHVDGVGEIAAIAADGSSKRFVFALPPGLAGYVAPKGSIGLDGVSLTVNEVLDGADGRCRFGVNLIPHTLEWTTFGSSVVGDPVNVEIDMLARYVGRLMAIGGSSSGGGISGGGISSGGISGTGNATGGTA